MMFVNGWLLRTDKIMERKNSKKLIGLRLASLHKSDLNWLLGQFEDFDKERLGKALEDTRKFGNGRKEILRNFPQILEAIEESAINEDSIQDLLSKEFLGNIITSTNDFDRILIYKTLSKKNRQIVGPHIGRKMKNLLSEDNMEKIVSTDKVSRVILDYLSYKNQS